MNCPECGHRLSRVLVTRRSDTGVYRSRICHAGHKFATHEMSVDVLTAAASVAGFIGESINTVTHSPTRNTQ